MPNSDSMTMVAKGMDVAARTLDLLAVVGGLTSATGAAALVARELGRWLGREGLDENELQFFLTKSQALVMPNQEETVVRFLKAVNSGRSHPTVVPFWQQPSLSMGRYLANDPLQQWITSTICCLFRYHDETFIKMFLSYFLVLSAQKDASDEHMLLDIQMDRMAIKVRLDVVVKKVVESTWLHIANAGLIGSDAECPRLPAEFDWACKYGHNLSSYHFAHLLRKLSASPKELILESQYLPTDVLLWLLCHYAGRLRVVVNAKIIYDRILGPHEGVVECRVATFCTVNKSNCLKTRSLGDIKLRIYDNLHKTLRLLLQPRTYGDPSPTGVFVRQRLYEWPDCYPREEEAIQKLTRATAREIMIWFLEQPLHRGIIRSLRGPLFAIATAVESPSNHAIRIGDLFGRSPKLLNKDWGRLKHPFTVFSLYIEGDDTEDENEKAIKSILHSFPILRDLVDDVQKMCECKSCHSLPTSSGHSSSAWRVVLRRDENCLAYLALSEVMFYFSHGIADAFGAPDAAGITHLAGAPDALLQTMHILQDILTDGGIFRWSTIFGTAVRVFLGTDCYASLAAAHADTQGIESTVVAVQYGSLAVVAPWLDVSQPLNHRRSFRFEIVHDHLALDNGVVDGQRILRRVSRDLCIIETHATDDPIWLDPASLAHMRQEPRTPLHLDRDESEQQWDWALWPVDHITSKLLLRAVSGAHSRIIDASHAFLALGHTIDIPACSHTTLDEGTVPEKALAELNSFEELLGRWHAWKYQLVFENSKPAADRCYAAYIRIARPLDTTFKFNVAVTLARDCPAIFINHGNCCVDCCFKFVMESDKIDTDIGFSYHDCIIHRTKDLNTTPLAVVPVRQGGRNTPRYLPTPENVIYYGSLETPCQTEQQSEGGSEPQVIYLPVKPV